MESLTLQELRFFRQAVYAFQREQEVELSNLSNSDIDSYRAKADYLK